MVIEMCSTCCITVKVKLLQERVMPLSMPRRFISARQYSPKLIPVPAPISHLVQVKMARPTRLITAAVLLQKKVIILTRLEWRRVAEIGHAHFHRTPL